MTEKVLYTGAAKSCQVSLINTMYLIRLYCIATKYHIHTFKKIAETFIFPSFAWKYEENYKNLIGDKVA